MYYHHPYKVLWDHHNYAITAPMEQVQRVGFLAYAFPWKISQLLHNCITLITTVRW